MTDSAFERLLRETLRTVGSAPADTTEGLDDLLDRVSTPSKRVSLFPNQLGPSRRVRGRLAVAAVVLVLAAVAGTVALSTGEDGRRVVTAASGPPAAVPPRRLPTVKLATSTPWAITAGFGSSWLQAEGVTEVRDGAVVATIPVEGENAEAIAAGAGAVWLPTTTRPRQTGYEIPEGEAKLVRIDPERREVAAMLELGPGSATGVVANDERVWVAVEIHDGPGRIVEVDPASMAVVREIRLGTGASAIALSESALWAGSGEGLDEHQLLRIDPSSGRVTDSLKFSQRIDVLAATNDVVWAGTGNPQEDAKLTKVDARSLSIESTVDLGDQQGVSLAIDGDSVWVSVSHYDADHFPDSTATLVQIGEADGEVMQVVELGDGITKGVAVQGSEVQATVFSSLAEGAPTGELHRFRL